MLYIGPRTWLDLRAKCFCLTRKQTVAPGLTILSALKPHMYMRTKLSALKPHMYMRTILSALKPHMYMRTILSALKPHMYMRTKLSALKPNLCTYVVHISKYGIASYYKMI